MPDDATHPLEAFPHATYLARWRVLKWRPLGVLDDALIDQVVDFVSLQEQIADTAFHRFIDLSGLLQIRIKIGHVFNISQQRRDATQGLWPVKSAFFSDSVIGYGVARLYESLMQGASIEVRAFRVRSEVVEWLGVPIEFLFEKETDMGPKSDGIPGGNQP